MLRTTSFIASLSLLSTPTFAQGNAACDTPNPPFFCGSQGEPGPQGPTGPEGQDGADGSDGQDGSQGPKGDTGDRGPAGQDGSDGADGEDGRDGKGGARGPAGRDGQSLRSTSYEFEGVTSGALAASTAIGGLQMYDPAEGETTWGAGLGGQFDGEVGIAVGIRHGFTDDFSGYATIGTSFEGRGTSFGIGVSGRF